MIINMIVHVFACQISDDDREKTEPTLHSTASGKSKKKKKKKKKQGEEASSPVQVI